MYKAKGQVQNFQDVLNNIFQPLFEATLEPAKHPEIFRFMTEVCQRYIDRAFNILVVALSLFEIKALLCREPGADLYDLVEFV